MAKFSRSFTDDRGALFRFTFFFSLLGKFHGVTSLGFCPQLVVGVDYFYVASEVIVSEVIVSEVIVSEVSV